jgi:hypothetical protein
LICIPIIVGRGDLRLPVLLDKTFKILAVSGSRIGNVMVRQPSLKLVLVPFVVNLILIHGLAMVDTVVGKFGDVKIST